MEQEKKPKFDEVVISPSFDLRGVPYGIGYEKDGHGFQSGDTAYVREENGVVQISRTPDFQEWQVATVLNERPYPTMEQLAEVFKAYFEQPQGGESETVN